MINSNSFSDVIISAYINNSYNFVIRIKSIKKLVLLNL